MLPKVQTFWLPKQGNTAEEYEDAFAYSLPSQRFGVADGATESSFADIWAKSLVRAYSEQPPSGPDLDGWLQPMQSAWHDAVPWDRLPWFAEEKAKNGAFAALLGIEFLGCATAPPPPPPPPKPTFWERFFGRSRPQPAPEPDPQPKWRAISVGDSCMFQIRGERMMASFPIDRAEQFNARPLLLCSNPSWNHTVRHALKTRESTYDSGDCFLLATDALAHWFLSQFEAGGKPWNSLLELNSDSDYAAFIAKKRQEGHLKNDDTTLILVRWESE